MQTECFWYKYLLQLLLLMIVFGITCSFRHMCVCVCMHALAGFSCVFVCACVCPCRKGRFKPLLRDFYTQSLSTLFFLQSDRPGK